MSAQTVQVKCRLLRETERALLLCQVDGEGTIACWVARSECTHISKGPHAQDGSRDAVVTLSEWLARVNKLEPED